MEQNAEEVHPPLPIVEVGGAHPSLPTTCVVSLTTTCVTCSTRLPRRSP